MKLRDLSDVELLYRAFAHEHRGLDADPYWQALESRFPTLSRDGIWQYVAPRGAMWVPQAEERYGRLRGGQYAEREAQTSLALEEAAL